MNFLTAEQARALTDAIKKREGHGALGELLGSIRWGKDTCTIYLGTELTKKEVTEKMDMLRALGFKVFNYSVATDNKGDPREPYRTFPAEHRVDISW